MQTQTFTPSKCPIPMPVDYQPEHQSRIFVSPFGARVEVTRNLTDTEKLTLEYAALNYSFVLKTQAVYEECGCVMTRGVPMRVWSREIRRVYDATNLRTAIVLDLIDSL